MEMLSQASDDLTDYSSAWLEQPLDVEGGEEQDEDMEL